MFFHTSSCSLIRGGQKLEYSEKNHLLQNMTPYIYDLSEAQIHRGENLMFESQRS